METKQFIQERALATRGAQENIAAVWVWPYKTVAEWVTALLTFDTQEEAVVEANTMVLARQGAVEMAFAELHSMTVQVLGLFRTMVEMTSATDELMMEALTASGKSRAEIVDEAMALASGWEKVDDTWLPVPAVTLASFKAKIAACQEILGVYKSAQQEYRRAVGKWNGIANGLNRDCMAWYCDATHVFPVGTPEGDMIRSTVPTTTELTPEPDQALMVLDEVEPGMAAFTLSAEHASKFDVYERLVGEMEWTKVGVDVLPGLYVREGLAAGDYEFKAAGMNSRGTGPESSPVAVTIPLLQVAA